MQTSHTEGGSHDMEGLPVDGDDAESLCADRWKNLSAESTKRMWGIFDQTGIFIAACRHGVVQAMCDMIKSGELYVIAYVPIPSTLTIV